MKDMYNVRALFKASISRASWQHFIPYHYQFKHLDIKLNSIATQTEFDNNHLVQYSN
jgi:hypothetical protein